jgi:hypothetical protein
LLNPLLYCSDEQFDDDADDGNGELEESVADEDDGDYGSELPFTD